jgi:inorganic triphosphatase YgiF
MEVVTMEIEAKYAVVAPFAPAALDAIDLRPYALSPGGAERHHDQLLDTPARALTSRRLALRLRHIGDRIIITFKGPNIGTGATHEREEIEAAVRAPLSADFHQWPDAIVAHIEPLIGAAPLVTLVELDVTRIIWYVTLQGAIIAELALDDGVITANGQTTEVHELEIELKGSGGHEDLRALQDMLTRHLPLREETRSKLEQGLVLFH